MMAARKLWPALLAAAALADGGGQWSAAQMPAAPRESGGWVLVERGLQGTGGVLKGAGDIVSLGVGGTFRLAGSFVRFLGSGIETVGNAVVSGAVKSAGDGFTMLGDTTERIAGEALGIMPDAVDVVQSGVGALRKRVRFDVNEDSRELLQIAETRAMASLQLRPGAPAESLGWLNVLLAAGWTATWGPYLHETLTASIERSLATLPLPRTLSSIALTSLQPVVSLSVKPHVLHLHGHLTKTMNDK
ncbi:hypothetical protein EMIHUDRAFT_455355 [Emiliania huxleyi CCMP1516]|uniref:Uncharacterized protein n=2 Tax=Emiliania huxleyi TaxID=2903 RepID=A0A0D3KHQ4_EMIH1|nr:hypothetical protein EMIHUDRAFT_455355 [Emiliania huxleyi CCMP1516]EOD35289.1 hypothetical protein EMIHUDRAFT_455355 [Emiliania huxleyi CCMP1516]|eukprot:XP_005787718.1 hypothetical protein EMIHUDRAFT_455355 [Emiliania huxleyi CCMP1516]